MSLRFPLRLLAAGLLLGVASSGGCASDDSKLAVSSAAQPTAPPSIEECLARWSEPGDTGPGEILASQGGEASDAAVRAPESPPPRPPAPAKDSPPPRRGSHTPSLPMPPIPIPEVEAPPVPRGDYGSAPPAADVDEPASMPSTADVGMWPHLPLAFVLASLFLCAGCLVAAWIRLRNAREDAERLSHEFDLRNREHDDAYDRLEGRVEDMAGRLAQSTSARRQLSVSIQRLSTENRALAGSLRDVRSSAAVESPGVTDTIAPALLAPESVEMPEVWAATPEPEAPEATVFEFEQAMETVLTLAEEPFELPPAPLPASEPAREEEVTSAQGDEAAMAAWNENPQHPPIPDTGPSFAPYTGGAGFLDSMDLEPRAQAFEPRPQALEPQTPDVEPPALRSEREPEAWQRAIAAVESLREATAQQGVQLEAVARRCDELERRIEDVSDRVPERVEALPAPAPVPAPEVQSDVLIRQVELEGRVAVLDAELRRKSEICGTLEARLTSREEDLLRKTRECEALAADLPAVQRKLDAAERDLEDSDRRIEGLEQRLARKDADAEDRLRQEQDLHRTVAARADDLEAQVASRDAELARKSAEGDALQAELAASRRRIEAAERVLSELEQRIAEQSRDDEERLVAEKEQHRQTESRASALEARLAGRDEQLRQRADMIELLQGEVVAKNREVEAAAERCVELEQRLQRANEEEASRARREEEISQRWTSRSAELEGHLAGRDEDLRQRSAVIERLEREAEDKGRRIDAADQRCAELERDLERIRGELGRSESDIERSKIDFERRTGELQRDLERQTAELQREHDRRTSELQREQERRIAELEREIERRDERAEERVRHEQNLQQALATRVAELEARNASLGEDLAQRSSSIDGLQQDVSAKAERAQEATERCAELERDLAMRDEELVRLRDERAQLADGCRELTERLDARARDQHLQEQHLGEVQARADASEATVRRRAEDVQAGDVLVDELVDNRLSALFKKRTPQSSEPLSELYLDNLEQGDFDHAMQALLGDPEPIGEASLARLGARWRREHEAWRSSPLEREVVYLWADGVRLRAGHEKPEDALLAVVASHADGSRSVVAIESGDPASKDAWLGVLRALAQRGMNVPRAIVAAGASGLWVALDELGWDCARQYCWTHETAEVLSGLPKKRRAQSEKILRAAADADTRAAAKKLRDRFVKRCGVRCASAGQRLSADWKPLTSFYAFPEDHWQHLQSTQIVAAPLEGLRLSASAGAEPKTAKPSPNVEAVLWKVLGASCRSAKKLSGFELLPPVAEAEPSARAKGRSRTKAA